MITELKPIIDRAESVSVLLHKPDQEGGEYTATLIVVGGEVEVPPLQITGTIEELDNAVSQAFNEGAEVYDKAANDIEAFKAAARKSADDKQSKPSSKPAKKTVAKKTAASATKAVPAPKPETPPKAEPKAEPAKNTDQQADLIGMSDQEIDEETRKAYAKLGL